MIGSQQLDRMTEADALSPHHPVDGRPACIAGSQAVPEILRWSDDEGRCPVVMERAPTQKVRTVPGQLDPSRFGQPLDRDFFL
jgi:hypothetical protein